MELTKIKGIGEKTAALFSKLNINDTADLLTHYPRDYDYYEPICKINDLSLGLHSICAKIVSNISTRNYRGKSITTCRISDGTGEVTLCYFNMPYVKKALADNDFHVFRGVVSKKGEIFVMNQPKMIKPEEYDKLVSTYQPIYSTTKGLSSASIQKAVKKAYETELISGFKSNISPLYDSLPKEIIEKRKLMALNEAMLNMHTPKNLDILIEARKRIAYQEFFDFILKIEESRDKKLRTNHYPMIEVAETNRLIEALPYELTTDQMSVWTQIKNDMCGEHGLMRLVQGDVGSGKTIIAFLSLVMTACNGYQGALMAPTEVLANQHFEALNSLLNKHKLPIRPILLTGNIKGAARKEALNLIQSGEANVIIGTHALFQEKVEYKNLALVITDEQHRFGVIQRDTFKEKGGMPHVLIMSATPIPRTLAMILYGDLEVSAIHTMPTGRLPIKNCVVDTGFRNKAYEFALNEIKAGHQVYIICPQVESGDLPGVENVVDYAHSLKEQMPEEIRIEYLHGKMKSSKKDEIMDQMAKGNIDILVSTTVIEVGVNIPNATLMYVENAERFGLAQLHQLRGRVGRSNIQSYCIFMMGQASDKSKSRLSILEKSNDGFEIASADMKLRGPGDIFGIRQSGEMNFIVGDIYQDADLITYAAEDVRLYINNLID